MAKKRGRRRVNKSQAIRDYLQQDPGATPKQIVTALAERGVKVSEGLAGNVKYTSGPGGARRGRGRGRGRPRTRRVAVNTLSAQDLVEAKKLADQLGGIEQARRALEALEQLR
jgi:hypothetical protein